MTGFENMVATVADMEKALHRMSNEELWIALNMASEMTDTEVIVESFLADFILYCEDFIKEECIRRFAEYAHKHPSDII